MGVSGEGTGDCSNQIEQSRRSWQDPPIAVDSGMGRAKPRKSAGAPVLHRTVADLRALAPPLRLRMMELFAESPKTTKQVAELLGQPPTRLYHHVAALERAGLLVLTETRQNRGTVEKWYAGVAQQVSGAAAGKSAAARGARRALAAT